MRKLFVLVLFFNAVSGVAQFTTSGTTTATSNNVVVGNGPVAAKMTVYGDTARPAANAIYGWNYSAWGFPTGLLFTDTSDNGGLCCGVVATLQGNGYMRVGDLQLGFQGTGSVMSMNSTPLYLNHWSSNDVVISNTAYGNGLRVEGFGASSFGGAVGIGTTSPGAQLHLVKSAAGALGPELRLENTGNAVGDSSAVSYVSSGWPRAQITSRVEGVTPFAGTLEFRTGFGNLTEKMRITGSGNVGIGVTSPNNRLEVAGNIVATGTITAAAVINATYQDVAEWVPAKSTMAAGTVVVLSPDVKNEVMASTVAYDTTVAGVVSAQPGIILGQAAETKAKIATTGRVKVHVDAGARGIKIGDLLVTSGKPGTAMVSLPVDVGGIKLHRPGTLIGKALEPLATGEGEVLVLLSLQ